MQNCYVTTDLMFKFFQSNSASSSIDGSSSGGAGSENNSTMGSTKDLHQKDYEIKMRDSRIQMLEQELKKKDETIKNLNRELDKYRSVLQPTSPTAVVAKTRQRLQGISAEPQTLSKAQAQAQPLKRHSKSSR